MLNRTDEVELVCVANGTGSIQPKLEWMVDGRMADPEVLKTWEVIPIILLTINLMWAVVATQMVEQSLPNTEV